MKTNSVPVNLEFFNHSSLPKFVNEVQCGICLEHGPNKTNAWVLHLFSTNNSCATDREDSIRNHQVHIFHRDCGLRWISDNQTCPNCMLPIDANSLEKIIEENKEGFFLAAREGDMKTVENLFWEFPVSILEEAVRKAGESGREEVVKFLLQSEKGQKFSPSCLVKALSFLVAVHKEFVGDFVSRLPIELCKAMLREADHNDCEEIKELLRVAIKYSAVIEALVLIVGGQVFVLPRTRMPYE